MLPPSAMFGDIGRIGWCARQDLNPQPSEPKSDALSVEPRAHLKGRWGGWRGSNPRPPDPQSGALPAELQPPRR